MTLGSWAAQWPWAGIAMVSLVAVAAVWLCNSLAVGPPAHTCSWWGAAGVGTSSTHLPPWVLGLLVLAAARWAGWFRWRAL